MIYRHRHLIWPCQSWSSPRPLNGSGLSGYCSSCCPDPAVRLVFTATILTATIFETNSRTLPSSNDRKLMEEPCDQPLGWCAPRGLSYKATCWIHKDTTQVMYLGDIIRDSRVFIYVYIYICVHWRLVICLDWSLQLLRGTNVIYFIVGVVNAFPSFIPS